MDQLPLLIVADESITTESITTTLVIDESITAFLQDTDEILANDSVGPLAQRILASMDPSIDPAEAIFPITKIPGTDLPSPLPFPNLNRVYFKIGKPIDAAGINPKDVAACSETYANVRTSVEEQISDLLLVRESDPDSSAIGRLVNSAQRLWPRAPM